MIFKNSLLNCFLFVELTRRLIKIEERGERILQKIWTEIQSINSFEMNSSPNSTSIYHTVVVFPLQSSSFYTKLYTINDIFRKLARSWNAQFDVGYPPTVSIPTNSITQIKLVYRISGSDTQHPLSPWRSSLMVRILTREGNGIHSA